MENRGLTTQEASQYLGIAAKTLKLWRYRKTGPRFMKMGYLVRYRMEDLQAFQEASLVNPEARAAKYASV